MEARYLDSKGDTILKKAISVTAVLAMLTLCGCSSSSSAPPLTQQAATAKTELHFNLDQCQPAGGNLYKCPASDKAVCDPNYHSDNGVLQCVRTGADGSIYVQNGIMR